MQTVIPFYVHNSKATGYAVNKGMVISDITIELSSTEKGSTILALNELSD